MGCFEPKLDRCSRPWACFVELIRRFPFSAAQVWGGRGGTVYMGEPSRLHGGTIWSVFAIALGWLLGVLDSVLGGLGRFWGVLGAVLGRLGAVWGRSWSPRYESAREAVLMGQSFGSSWSRRRASATGVTLFGSPRGHLEAILDSKTQNCDRGYTF